ncbi:MAG TPA: hypothetical protein IAA15_02685 [Candidatus Olsenella pullicola]|nr:hypothetical protein [Candidatus Olsenella pullicola]
MAGAKGSAVEVDGIEVTVVVDPADDYELIECACVSSDPGAGVEERNRAYFRRNHILLGDGYDRVMGELRAANGGRLPRDVVASFMSRVVAGVAEAKNS